MNFDEWYKLNQGGTYTSDFVDPLERFGKLGWNACKQEVLKILKDKNNISINGDTHTWKSIDYDVLDEIEKL